MPSFRLQPAERFVLNSFVDCNLAQAWIGDRLRIFPGKYGEDPVWGDATELVYADGRSAEEVLSTPASGFVRPNLPPNSPPGTAGLHGAVWFETVLRRPEDASGNGLFAVYHNENYPATLPFDAATGEGYRGVDWPPGLHGAASEQAVCRIGIMSSSDGGASWVDRGIILEDRDPRLVLSPVNRNNTFPGGVGDPSAVVSGEYVYLFFGEYGYPGEFDRTSHDPSLEASGQCISVARIPLASVEDPVGRARRWDGATFAAAADGVGAPIRALQIPAHAGGGAVSSGSGRFYWGASVSWNEYLECWVMLMARVDSGYWVGDSVFISFNPNHDLGPGTNSQHWTTPQLLLEHPGHTLWYPSLQPLSTREDVDTRRSSLRLGRRAALFVKHIGTDVDYYGSDHLIEFDRD